MSFIRLVKAWPKDRQRQNLGLLFGGFLGCVVLVVWFWPGQERLHMPGPSNVGHETLECEDCHQPAAGTVRQQLQAEVQYLTGLRQTPIDFGYQAVGNVDCLACHARPNDRHPVFRFVEPRFADAREALQPQFCTSCHLEHTGERVTVGEITYCRHCHQDTQLNNDPLTISHETLIQAENWASCLGCHDFHGNHIMEVLETDVQKVIPPVQLEAYFAGQASPYPTAVYYPAKETRP